MNARRKFRRSRGNSLAEVPAVLYLLVLGLLVPLMAMVLFCYRFTLVFFAVRNAASQAARSQTYSLAKTAAANTWASDTAAWGNGNFTVTNPPTLWIVTHTIADGTINGKTNGGETVTNSPLPQNSVNPATHVYFYRLIASVTINPWFNGGSFLQIPGLTMPYTTTMNYQEVVENTSGLSS